MYTIQSSMFHCQPWSDRRNYKNRRKSMMALWISSTVSHAVPFILKYSVNPSHIRNFGKPCKIFSLSSNSVRRFFNDTGINLRKVSQRHRLPWQLNSTWVQGGSIVRRWISNDESESLHALQASFDRFQQDLDRGIAVQTSIVNNQIANDGTCLSCMLIY